MPTSGSRGPQIDPAYAELLAGVLRFKTLAETEQTLARLEKLRHRFLAASDKKGVENCRRLGILGRRRADLVARNRRVRPGQRLLKQEAALWFRIWVETPEIFPGWLALRKSSEEFQRLRDLEAPDRSA